ncbi:uncharacterized protein CtIP [Eurosta solidaginis]|uniref:uncharacterized protein CtIP n=1 Tax=Eurosta solidaginis TaxID=178769 RepID=UPI00353152C0
MPCTKKDFDLTDKGWVDLYVEKCESLMKEFTNYVYALQHLCVEERSRSEKLEENYKSLQSKVANLNKEQKEPRKQYKDKSIIQTPKFRHNTSNISLVIENNKTPAETDRTTISDGSPAFLNMAMDSEQLQIDATCILSPGQHGQELTSASEQLSSPPRLTATLDTIGSIFKHNTSPTCISKNNENKSALGFLKARGRVGKSLHTELREHNCASSEEDNGNDFRNKAKLHAKNSDWLGKNTKIDNRRAMLKRASTDFDDIQKKRALLSLNKSGERKLKQSRLTQIVAMQTNKIKDESASSASTSPESSANAQQLTTTKQQLLSPSFSTNTDDIFHFSSDEDDDNQCDKEATGLKEKAEKLVDATFLRPQPRETEKSESVIAITPTAPPIICLDETEYNEIEDENMLFLKTIRKAEATNSRTEKATSVNKKNKEKLPNELAAAMLAEWEEEVENEEELVDDPEIKCKLETAPASERKPRLSEVPTEKISIKECFNIDCDECQKYIDFMGSNMRMTDIEAHLRRCTRHRSKNDCIPVTPPGYWNPLMPSFSDSDPRNKTLLEDPYLQRKISK